MLWLTNQLHHITSIHQPIILQVAYHGIPEKAYEVFVNTLTTRFLDQGLVIPELEDHNPAGEKDTSPHLRGVCCYITGIV